MNLDEAYIEFNEDCLDYTGYDEYSGAKANIFMIRTIIQELACKYNDGKNIFVNDLLRYMGGEEIPDGWKYGLAKGKSISPDKLKIDYSGKYIKIFLKGFVPTEQIYDKTEFSFLKGEGSSKEITW